jgi:hypothetical protein
MGISSRRTSGSLYSIYLPRAKSSNHLAQLRSVQSYIRASTQVVPFRLKKSSERYYCLAPMPFFKRNEQHVAIVAGGDIGRYSDRWQCPRYIRRMRHHMSSLFLFLLWKYDRRRKDESGWTRPTVKAICPFPNYIYTVQIISNCPGPDSRVSVRRRASYAVVAY